MNAHDRHHTYRCMPAHRSIIILLMALCAATLELPAQVGYEKQHTRGKLWENLNSDGWIGSWGAWDYGCPYPMGMYPGFKGYRHPLGSENDAWGTYVNANMHDFRSGVWIVVKGMNIPGAPPTYTPIHTDYEVYTSGLQEAAYGVAETRIPLALTQNFIEKPGFDPLLPEEIIDATWDTNTGITVTRHSYAWSFPGYRDFILYDYTFKNTGVMVSTQTDAVAPGYPSQTLADVHFVFHSGISVSTKSQINFHSYGGWKAVAAGGFGWEEQSYHDYYKNDGDTLMYSYNRNGGKEPLYDVEGNDPLYARKDPSDWTSRFGNELQSPSAFGWLALYASPTGIAPRASGKPDVRRIDSHKGGLFNGSALDLQALVSSGKKKLYDFCMTPDTQATLGNAGNRLNFYTYSYGPYKLAPGDSVRIILAEIAGVMDYAVVNNGGFPAGDTSGHSWFPDSTIAAIRRNAVNASNAVRWGLGATAADGRALAADVPEPPPGPKVTAVNESIGGDTAVVAVRWDMASESAVIKDGAGATFYDGVNDLDGYHVYRTSDMQFTADGAPTVLRGATWTLVKDIAKADFGQYRVTEEGVTQYKWSDRGVKFSNPYAYYVAAYRAHPKPWTSANGTRVSNLPLLENGDVNRTPQVIPFMGPSSTFDVFVVPNPYVYNDPLRSFGINNPYRLEFRNLPERCTLRIYTVAGDLVKVLEHQPDALGNLSGSEPWDQKSESGLLVAPGLYIYHLNSLTPGVEGSKTGKFMIVR